MKETLRTHGPAVQAEQLVDIYQARADEHSPWVAISDQVMGGESSGGVRECWFGMHLPDGSNQPGE